MSNNRSKSMSLQRQACNLSRPYIAKDTVITLGKGKKKSSMIILFQFRLLNSLITQHPLLLINALNYNASLVTAACTS